MPFIEKLMFSDLVFMLEKVIGALNVTTREKYIKKYIDKIIELQTKYKTEYPGENADIYPLLRILLSNDNERSYGIQEKSLRKILINSLKVTGSDAKRIEQCNETEINSTVYEIVKSRSSRESKLTVQDVDNMLNELCENQKQQFQQKQFDYLFLNGSAYDFKWIVRIILKNMKLKVNPSKILENYHPLAPKLFLKFNHLSKVCEIVESGKAEEYAQDLVKPFLPVRAMLSQKFSTDMNNMLESHEFYQEIKLDGERFQLHMENGTFKFFSRNAHDFSDNFNMLLSPLIKFKAVIHSIIMDGEMIIWNKTKQRFITKGETDMDVKKLKDPNHHLRPCFCAFDVLYLNGVSFIKEPFYKRCEILNSLFDDQIGIMVKTQPIKIRNVEHLVELFNKAMEKEEEGIILKKSDSIYVPGERTCGWYKVKADYFDGDLVKDFDCVIVGGKFNNPHKRDYLKTYQVGAVEKHGSCNYNVYVIGEVTHGLSIVNRRNLNEKLSSFFIDFRGNQDVADFEKGQVHFGREKPDVFIPPHKSVVLQIRVSELAPSKTDFYTNYSFRFPRIYEVRYDKFWDESTSLKEYQDIYQKDDATSKYDRRVKKVNQRCVHRNDIVSPSRKKRKLLSSRSSAIEMFCHDSQDDIEPIDHVLEGKEFCVLTTHPKLPSVHDLKVLVRLHGGSITEFPRKNKTFAIICGEIKNNIKMYINEKIYNVIKVEWFLDNFNAQQPLDDFPDLRPGNFYFIKDTMREKFATKFDKYGDSYTELFANVDELKEFLNEMSSHELDEIDAETYKEFEAEIYNKDFKNPNFFRGFKANFHETKNNNYLMKIAKSIYEYRAGIISESFSSCPYIFVDKYECSKSKVNNQQFVDFQYILKSNDAGKLLNIKDYNI